MNRQMMNTRQDHIIPSFPRLANMAWTFDLTTPGLHCGSLTAFCGVAELVPQWSTHVGNNTVLEDDVVFLHKQEELAVAHGLGKKPVAQVSMQIYAFGCFCLRQLHCICLFMCGAWACYMSDMVICQQCRTVYCSFNDNL